MSARAAEKQHGAWYRARGWIAGGVVGALIVTIAVVSSGFDAQEVLRKEANVWVSRDAGQYARVNTETGEIDTVRKVTDPSGVLQIGAESVVLSNSNGQAWPVNPAVPVDFAAASAGASTAEAPNLELVSGEPADENAATSQQQVEPIRMPDGTRDIVTAGKYVLLRTEAGVVYAGMVNQAEGYAGGAGADELASRLRSLQHIDPAGEDAAKTGADELSTRIDAIALTDTGVAALYSAADGKIWRYDTVRGALVGSETELPGAATGLASAQLALVAGDWVLLDPETGTVWREGADAVQLELAGSPLLQSSGVGEGQRGGAGTNALVADIAGLWSVPKQGVAARIAEADGTPARPHALGEHLFAAWIGQNGGTLWSSENANTQSLEFDEAATDLGEVSPLFFTNGDRAVLGETRTGMLWTLPDGRLIPLAQWTISDPPKEDQGTVVVDDVTEQVPPTAVNDDFGVRAGEPAPLPVLLNDFDPNKRDVLTIVPESLTETPLSEDFGTLELAADAQSLMVHPKPGAQGTATFSYRITDGAQSSALATVTLSVKPDSTNSAPDWCLVDGCQRTWSVPAIAPGGTLVYPILEGWVDPEGDAILLSDVGMLRPEDPAHAIVTADGRLAVRHTDVNAGASEIMLRLTVRDSRGEERKRDLLVSVQPGAPAEFSSMAAAVQVNETMVLTPLDRVTGGSGSFQLTDVTVQHGSERVQASARLSEGAIAITASAAGEALLSLGVRDIVTGNEFTGAIRVIASPGSAPLTLPPLRAFVRPLSDSTVEILDVIPGASSRSLSVQSANIVDGELRADIMEHSRVRVAGSTPDGGPGRVGAVDVTVTEGSASARGRLTVFQVPESDAKGAIAVADSATVRAGAVVDIRVLDNDASSPGERLVLHPEVTGSGAKGELAFASGSTLRYLAPKQPGVYRLSYTTYSASNPEAGDVGVVTVNVLPSGANQDPTPAMVTVRVAPGEQGQVEVPLSGVDPDGDRVRLISVDPSENTLVTASVSFSGTALVVSASGQATPGLTTTTYSVRDGQGGTGVGRLRIIVTPPAADAGAPIASSDYVRLVKGSLDPVVVRPLDNDVDPTRGNLKIVSVVPNVPNGEANSEYRRLRARLDLSQLQRGIVSIAPGDELGTVSYKYTVQSSTSKSTSDGLLLVQTSERVGAQAPRVTDTVLNVRERSDISDRGVDVVTDKVRWVAGDPASLKLSLWGGNAGGYRIDGKRIVGPYNPDGDLVAFKLSGVDASGTEVATYGFLIVPPLDELRITLLPGLTPLQVDENKSVDAGLRSFLDLNANDRVELSQKSFTVGRAQASCAAISASEIRYTAGGEAPWFDTCLVSVRLVGQSNWTSLPVPVNVVPRAPVVQLNALTRTIAPGATESIDLNDMISWQGNRAGDMSKLRFSVTGGGTHFAVEHSGTVVTAAARADATPGSQETLQVSVAGEGESLAPFTLRIGEAPKDQPRGGTVNLTCTVGADCRVDVVGVPGEYDPFSGKTGGGLELISVSAASCTIGTVTRASDKAVSVAWPETRGPGGRCTVGFTVGDAQGRIGEGTIELDAQGVPRAPASLTPQSFTGNSVTFVVELGDAQSAHPSVTGVEVSGAGSSSCTPAGPASYQCVVTGLTNGERHSFTARAINAVGSSDPSSAAAAWAYQTPEPPKITGLASVPDERVTQSQGVIEFGLEGGDDVAGYRVTIGGQTYEYHDRNVTDRLVVPVGSRVFSVVSLSAFEPPAGGQLSGAAGQGTVVVIGSPLGGNLQLSSPGFEQLKATVGAVDPNFADVSTLRYFFSDPAAGRGNAAPCPTTHAAYGVNGQTFPVNNHYRTYEVRGCVSNGYGWTDLGVKRTSAQQAAGESVPVPSGSVTYTVGPDPTGTETRGEYVLAPGGAPTPVADEGMELQYLINGNPHDEFFLDSAYVSVIQVRQCADFSDENTCSAYRDVTPTGAPTTVWAELTNECVPLESTDVLANLTISAAASGFATAKSDATGQVTITWTGAFLGLTPLVLQGVPCGGSEGSGASTTT